MSTTLMLGLIVSMLAVISVGSSKAQEGQTSIIHEVAVGDTWVALSRRFNVDLFEILALNPTINPQRQPVIGSQINIPSDHPGESTGNMVSSNAGGLLQLALTYGASPWLLSLTNDLAHPYFPLLYRPILIPDNQTTIRQFPQGLVSLELSSIPARPGEALAIRAHGPSSKLITASLDDRGINLVANGQAMVGLFATGAFFLPGDYELRLTVANEPPWSQPWRFVPGQWTFEEVTFSGSAAAIDSESIAQERERLRQIWATVSDEPNWQSQFNLPLNNYLSVSSEYGARRSYNGGPYQSYHEGLDFSAYGGTEVVAPAPGYVVLAEPLYVRGGAVIIDHGLGLYSGTYHMQEILVQTDQSVEAGQPVGLVGSTGLSTGNHLHWDLLVGGEWVNPQAWIDSNLACWILEGWGTTCQTDGAN